MSRIGKDRVLSWFIGGPPETKKKGLPPWTREGVHSPHLMGCRASLWPLSYRSCEGCMKCPPSCPSTGGQECHKEEQGASMGFLCCVSLYLARGPRALPITPCEDALGLSGSLHRFPGLPQPWAVCMGVLVRRCSESLPCLSVQVSPGYSSEGEAAQAGTPRTWPPLSPLLRSGLHLSTSEKVFRFQDTGLLLRVLGSLFLGGVLAFGLGFSEFLLVSRTSSLTLSIAGIFKVQTPR